MRPGIALIGLLVCLLSGIGLIGAREPAKAATTERVVVNRFSGVAIEGFDPVAYFVDGQAYGPQFGGYDPADIARGVTIAGNPHFFAIVAQRLYLFNREATRDAFVADPDRILYEVGKRWPALQEKLGQ